MKNQIINQILKETSLKDIKKNEIETEKKYKSSIIKVLNESKLPMTVEMIKSKLKNEFTDITGLEISIIVNKLVKENKLKRNEYPSISAPYFGNWTFEKIATTHADTQVYCKKCDKYYSTEEVELVDTKGKNEMIFNCPKDHKNQKSVITRKKQAKKLTFHSLFSTPANDYGLIIPRISEETLMASETTKAAFEYIKDDASVSCFVPTTRAHQWKEVKYQKRVLKYEGEWKPEYSAIHAGRRRQKRTPQMPLHSTSFAGEQVFPQEVKHVYSKYENKLLEKGVAQIQFGSEFIEDSFALALDKEDLIALARTRSHKGLNLWDVRMNNKIYQDPETKVYWMNTGSFD